MAKWNVNPSITKSDTVPPMAEDLGYDDDDFEEGAVMSGPPEEPKTERYKPAEDKLYSWISVGENLEKLKTDYIKARNLYVEALVNYENLASMEKESV